MDELGFLSSNRYGERGRREGDRKSSVSPRTICLAGHGLSLCKGLPTIHGTVAFPDNLPESPPKRCTNTWNRECLREPIHNHVFDPIRFAVQKTTPRPLSCVSLSCKVKPTKTITPPKILKSQRNLLRYTPHIYCGCCDSRSHPGEL